MILSATYETHVDLVENAIEINQISPCSDDKMVFLSIDQAEAVANELLRLVNQARG